MASTSATSCSICAAPSCCEVERTEGVPPSNVLSQGHSFAVGLCCSLHAAPSPCEVEHNPTATHPDQARHPLDLQCAADFSHHAFSFAAPSMSEVEPSDPCQAISIGKQCPTRFGPHSKRKDGTYYSNRPSSALSSSARQRRQDIGGTPVFQPLPTTVPAAGERSTIGQYTSFDAVSQDIVRDKAHTWGDTQCLEDAIAHSALPSPIGRVSQYVLAGFPTPQVIISQTAMRNTHHTVILVLTTPSRPSGASILVVDIPCWRTLHDFLFETAWQHEAVQTLWLHRHHLTCTANGMPSDCAAVVATSTDVLTVSFPDHVRAAHMAGPSSLAASSGGEILRHHSSARPATPPIPAQVWGPGRLSISDSAPVLDISSGSGTLSEAEFASATEFTVFDVYFHARVLPCRPEDSLETLAHRALEQTPQIGSAFHYRRVLHTLQGMPTPQIVIWGDCLPDAEIVPIALGPGRDSVCTVEVLHAYSALQITTVVCRRCQLPDFFIDAVAAVESALWINGRRCYPLDPNAGLHADTGKLIGFGVASVFGNTAPSTTQPSSSAQSSSQELRHFTTTLEVGQTAEASHFAVFCEPNQVLILPVPEGASLAELVYAAFGCFPHLAPRCGHRVLQRPIPGLPHIQLSIWDNLGPDQKVLQLVLGKDPPDIYTIRCPSVATPTQLAATFPTAAGANIAAALADRQQHLVADGIPLQATRTYMFRQFEVLRILGGPPPARLSSLSRFCRSDLPDELECVTDTDVTDADPIFDVVVHVPGMLPATIYIPPTARPLQASTAAAAALGVGPGYRLRFPSVSPLTAGTPAHAVLAPDASSQGTLYAICDFRHVARPGTVEFLTLSVPPLVTASALQDLLAPTLAELRPYRSIFVDQQRLFQCVSVASSACTITFLGWEPLHFTPRSPVLPVVLDTVQVTARRGGFRAAYARFEASVRTSTTTTTSRPTAGTGSPASSDSSTTQEEVVCPDVPTCTSPLVTSQGTEPVTNPHLLDFVSDPLAAHRVDQEELNDAYTLFDSIMQTRLAPKDPSWTAQDCLAEAHKHFGHVGHGALLTVIRDELEGLPSPQIAAIAIGDSVTQHVFPVDARSSGLGICVVNVPRASSAFTAAYRTSLHCLFTALHQKLARGQAAARASGRPFSPHEDLPGYVDTLQIATGSALPTANNRARRNTGRYQEMLEEIRDLADHTFELTSEFAIMLHWPGSPPVQFAGHKFWSYETLQLAVSSAIQYLGPHADLELHVPGACPRGTDAFLHLLVERDGCCSTGHTLFLFDGRALQIDGPPFRTAKLPAWDNLACILDVARDLFPQALIPRAVRVNGRLVTRWEHREYAFPLVRLLPDRTGVVEVSPADDSCLPSHFTLDFLPGLLQHVQPMEPHCPTDAPRNSADIRGPPVGAFDAYNMHPFCSSNPEDPVPLGFEICVPSVHSATCEFIVLE